MKYSDLPNYFPRSINESLFDGYVEKWSMTQAERCTLIMLLSKIKPECAIEIGTAQGGSLSAISRFSKKVYTLDSNPIWHDRLAEKFPNVEPITGKSQITLKPLLERLQAGDVNLEFVLIDGDHSRDGVKQDIEILLEFRPTKLLYVVMHDSFNPDVRQGITDANWAVSPYVHCVELDFVPGAFHSRPDIYREMWGGFALALLLPVEREGDLVIQAYHALQFQTMLPHSVHHRQGLYHVRFLRALRRGLGIVKSASRQMLRSV
jgi:hypothetical protein